MDRQKFNLYDCLNTKLDKIWTKPHEITLKQNVFAINRAKISWEIALLMYHNAKKLGRCTCQRNEV
jgi:hypothetical protein